MYQEGEEQSPARGKPSSRKQPRQDRSGSQDRPAFRRSSAYSEAYNARAAAEEDEGDAFNEYGAHPNLFNPKWAPEHIYQPNVSRDLNRDAASGRLPEKPELGEDGHAVSTYRTRLEDGTYVTRNIAYKHGNTWRDDGLYTINGWRKEDAREWKGKFVEDIDGAYPVEKRPRHKDIAAKFAPRSYGRVGSVDVEVDEDMAHDVTRKVS